ncbi:hypothetical protein [Coxiella burnetii]|uniref:hypothetical protein n=1 Tax=Coxiella burnetii TaxID=777 RepID=UPI0011D17C5A|nr:hypothetical protein [Coxiella burnetii]
MGATETDINRRPPEYARRLFWSLFSLYNGVSEIFNIYKKFVYESIKESLEDYQRKKSSYSDLLKKVKAIVGNADIDRFIKSDDKL